MTQPENKAPEGAAPFLGWTNDKDILNQQREYWGAMNGIAQLRAEVELYLRRMAEQEATIRELSELKQSWKARIKELEALLHETLYRFEDGQWFPSDLYDKIWNAIKAQQ